MTDPQEQARMIVDTAVDQLTTLGMSRAKAAGLLGFQSVIRLALLAPDPDVRSALETIIREAKDALEYLQDDYHCPGDRPH